MERSPPKSSQESENHGTGDVFHDYHHHFHPRRHDLLQDVGGRAVRFSRGQFLPRYLHDNYHAIFDGPQLPGSSAEKYRACVLACAGIVPRQALDVSHKGSYNILELSPKDHSELSASRSVFVERAFRRRGDMYVRKQIAQFFAEYALQQNVHLVVSEKVIGEFLDEKTEARRKKELGNFILKEALGMSLDSLIPLHEESQKEGLLPAVRQRPLLKVVRTFLTNDLFPNHYGSLAHSLSRAS
jgi:hypothetical protein